MPSLSWLRRSRNKWRRRRKNATGKITFWQRRRQRARLKVALRNRQIREARSGPAAAARHALANVGKHEDAGRPNRAAWLDAWSREIGEWMVGQPWCGLSVWKAAQAGGKTLSKETVSTVAIRRMAMSATGGYRRWHPASASPQVGWVAIYGSSGPVHTGIYVGGGRIVEGNTSPANGGSQNDGGGQYIRTLAERRGWLLGWAEIDWS